MTGTMNLKELLTSNLRQSGIFVAFVAIVALFSVLHPNFLSRATSPTSSCSTPTSSSWPSA